MKIEVWDTYVQREDGKIMHFDILVDGSATPAEKVIEYGRTYLQSKAFGTKTLTTNECRFCHVEPATPQIRSHIEQRGFAIIEMENCK